MEDADRPVTTPEMRRVRVFAIWCDHFEAAPPALWYGEGGVVPAIRALTNYNYKMIRTTIQNGWNAWMKGVEYDGKRKTGAGGQNKLVDLAMVELQIACDSMEMGNSVKQTAALVNVYREERGLPAIGRIRGCFTTTR